MKTGRVHYFACRNCGANWGPAAQPSLEDPSLCGFCIKRVPTAWERMNQLEIERMLRQPAREMVEGDL